jgi:hypothetical protein
MDYSMHHVNNIKCSMCNNQIKDGIVRDGFNYCNTNCYQNKMFFDNLSQPKPQPKPQIQHQTQTQQVAIQKKINTTNPIDSENCRHYGTCATCNNTYKYCQTCVDKGDKWFCGKTCHTIYESSKHAQSNFPAVAFPFASNTFTIFPLSVNSRTGKMVF